jgi:hypothetical protein
VHEVRPVPSLEGDLVVTEHRDVGRPVHARPNTIGACAPHRAFRRAGC